MFPGPHRCRAWLELERPHPAAGASTCRGGDGSEGGAARPVSPAGSEGPRSLGFLGAGPSRSTIRRWSPRQPSDLLATAPESLARPSPASADYRGESTGSPPVQLADADRIVAWPESHGFGTTNKWCGDGKHQMAEPSI